MTAVSPWMEGPSELASTAMVRSHDYSYGPRQKSTSTSDIAPTRKASPYLFPETNHHLFYMMPKGPLHVVNRDNPSPGPQEPCTIRRDMGNYWRSPDCWNIASSRSTEIAPPSRIETFRFPDPDADEFYEAVPRSSVDSRREQERQVDGHLENGATIRLVSAGGPQSRVRVSMSTELPGARPDKFPSFSPTEELADPRQPFKKWVSSLRKKTLQRGILGPSLPLRAPLEIEDVAPPPTSTRENRPRHEKSSSNSSMGFVTAIKSASVSLASAALPLKLPKVRPASQRRFGNRSSRSEDEATRLSTDSAMNPQPMIDEGTIHRAVQRRRILEEFISSEESYIGDMKVLVNVYFTLLASVQSVTQRTRTSIQRNMLEILQLHEDLLGELHRVIPNSEYSEDICAKAGPASNGHVQWQGLDGVSEAERRRISSCFSEMSGGGAIHTNEQLAGLMALPKVVADVAQVFSKEVSDDRLLPLFEAIFLMECW